MSEQLSEPAFDIDSSPPGFDLRQVISRSAGSRVFEALHQQAGRFVALKVLDADPGRTDAVARFEWDCVTVRALRTHPHIRTILDSGRRGHQLWVAMELCPAGSLADRLAQRGPLPVADAADVLAKIVDALGTAHRGGVVHGDVSLANIMITEQGEPALGDFGIARLRAGRAGTTVGGQTLAYAPPEALNGEPATTTGDIYSLGASVWHLLEGRPPFSRNGDSGAEAVAARILSEPLPPLTRTDVPDELRALLATMTAKDPCLRPTELSAVSDEAAVIAARGRTAPDVGGGWPVGGAPPLPGPSGPQFEVVAFEEPPVAPRTLRSRWAGGLGSAAARVAAPTAVGLLLFGAVTFAVLYPLAAVDPAPQLPPAAEVAAPETPEPPPPGPVPDAAGTPVPPAEPEVPVAPAPAPAPAVGVAPGPSAPPDRPAGPGPGPAKPEAVTVSGSHALTQQLTGDCSASRYWTIEGPITFTVAPDGTASGSASGRGTGSTPATCGGVSGTLNWDHEYTARFDGRMRDGVLSATGTMVDTDRTTAAGCARDGRPVDCPSNPEAGTNRYPMAVSGRFDLASGAGLGAMKVEMTRPTAGTWSVR